ncbi:MAG TPA: IS4 family transposase [Pararhizobium sp.]|nr:IS4 family transposase [Pararhizobium sp.]
MRHDNSVFHQLLKHVPWAVFDRLVDEHRGDRRVRRLSCKSQFLAMLFAQLSGATSLREIEAGLMSHSARLYHLGGRCVARTTLAEANAKRPAGLFADLFAHMATASRRTRRQMGDSVRILDATRIELSSLSGGWLQATNGRHAVKLQIAYDPNAGTPLSLDITGERVNDIVAAKARPIEPGATYVFDLAYYDHAWWADLHVHGCRFVSRLKSHTRLHDAAEQPVAKGTSVLADRIGLLPQRRGRSRRNPFADPVREITVRIATGKIIRLLSNDLAAPAEEIASLYRQRWQIELFFKWIKQNLKLGHFLGTSENAVRIQVFVALIAYMLLRSAQATQTAVRQPLAFARLIRLNLMHRRPLETLKSPPKQPDNNPRQMKLELVSC